MASRGSAGYHHVMDDKTPFIALENVTLKRSGKTVFPDLSLELAGRRVGLVGNNGSGKSSLLRLVAGLVTPDSGTVRVMGRSTAVGRPDTGFLFQNPDHQILFPTVGEEIAFGLVEKGMDHAAAGARARELLAAHGCAGWEKRAVHELSEGQKQLVCLIAVLAAEPDVLLLDEPFSSLDLPTRYDFRDRLAGINQHILMASHDLDLLSDSGFDRIIWLDGGRVRAHAPPDSVIPAYRATVAGAGKARTA